MTQGPVDNYLNAEEEAYFNKRGSEDAEAKVEESLETDAVETTEEFLPEPDGDAAPVPESDEQDDEEASNEDEEEQEAVSDKSTRDYEKAFKTERHKRKELKEALEATNKRTTEMEALVAELKQSMAAKAQQTSIEPIKNDPPPPDPEEDPLGYQQYKINKLEQTQAQLNSYLKQQHDMQQRSSQEQAFMRNYQQQAAEFSKQTKDFNEAYKYLIKARFEEHKAAGYSDSEADSIAREEELAIVAKAYNDKINPAKRLYDLAVHRGFGTKAPTSKTSKNLDDIKRGIDNSKSLKSGGGQPDSKRFGIDDIDDMDAKTFDDFWNSLKRNAKTSR